MFPALSCRVFFGLAGIAFAAGLGPITGRAESVAVTIRYDLSLAGLPIGSASFSAQIQNGAYKIDASTKIGGVAALVSDAKGAASASGRVTAKSKLLANNYAIDTRSGKKHQAVAMDLAGGAVTRVAIEPAIEPRPDRVPVTDAHKSGVLDPLSALLVPVPGEGDVLTAAACKRTLPVFDGAQRFDIALAFSRLEKIESKGYSGTAVVCSARYQPIAGHRENREQVKFMSQNKDLEIWLAPINGTRVLAPWRITVGMQIGRLVIEATKVSQSSATAEAVAPPN